MYNAELAPTKREGRRWSAYNIFTLWANDVHSLGNYSFAIGLFALGLGGWQILLALGLGGVFLFLLLSLSGFMGEKTGVPFPVMSRIAFGTRGAQIPALIRGAIAIAWFGIQTYLASVVLRILIIALAPSARDPRLEQLPGVVDARLDLVRRAVGHPGDHRQLRHGDDPQVRGIRRVRSSCSR